MNLTIPSIPLIKSEVKFFFNPLDLFILILVVGIFSFICGRIFEDESKHRANRGA